MSFSKESEQIESRNSSAILLLFIVSFILFFLGSIGWLTGFKRAASYILDPVYTASSKAAQEITQFFTTVVHISEFREEYNQMKLTIAEYEIENLAYQKIKNENIDLRKQLNLSNLEDIYVESEVLDRIESDYITVDVGIQDGVSVGDIAVLGDSFIGIVIDSGQFSSKIRLPISKSSFLESYIVSSREQVKQRILSRAVVTGSSDGIRIENIGMNSDVENGDTVMVNDSKIGESLVLGTVVGLSEDPATTTRAGYVSPLLDYYDLTNIFIKIKDAT